MTHTLDNLFNYLDALEGPAPLEDLKKLLEDLDSDLEDLSQHIRYAEPTYRRNLVRASEWFNVWVLCWRNGQRSPIHDHKGSSCGLRVLEGTMTETLFEFAPNGHVKALFSRDLAPGGVIGSEDTDLHQVSNLQADNQDLVTLHVYSPPLVMMGTYSLETRGRGEEPMMIEFCDAAGI